MAYDKNQFDDPQTLWRAIYEKKQRRFEAMDPDEICDAFVSKYTLKKAPWLNVDKVYELSRRIQEFYNEPRCYYLMLSFFEDKATNEGLREYYGDTFPIERLQAWFFDEQYNQDLYLCTRQLQAMIMGILLEFVVENAEYKRDHYPFEAAACLRLDILEARLYKLVYESQTIEDIEDFALTPERCFRMTVAGYLPFTYKAHWMKDSFLDENEE